jgi:molybdopterin-guanine dinucleotide biosynthesis protein A
MPLRYRRWRSRYIEGPAIIKLPVLAEDTDYLAEYFGNFSSATIMQDLKTIHGFILVGGKSRRMGSDKARLQWAGKPLALRAAELLAPHVRDVTLLGQTERYADLGLTVLPDAWPDRGPLGAICTGLLNASCEWSIFLACDLPLLSDRVIRLIAAHAINTNSDAVVPHIFGGWQPLCAAYRSSCRVAFEKALDEGRLSIQNLLREIKVDALTPEIMANAGIDSNEFANINTPQDWDRITARAGANEKEMDDL